MYLLYLDESGTHGGSPVTILGGIAVHEQDTWHLQRRLHGALRDALPAGQNPLDYELHAADIKSPKKPIRGKRRRTSEWLGVPLHVRLGVLDAGYEAIANYECQDAQYPIAYFGAVVDRFYADRETRAYEEVLHKFDEMLTRQGHQTGTHQRGIVIHDKRVIEKDIQSWTARWRHVAGRIGLLTHLSDVPFFADSRATRCIQAADFVTWALWRFYGLPTPDSRYIDHLWDGFDQVNGRMHGLIHVTPAFRAGGCGCRPCTSRVPSAAAIVP
jgi:Protein of unknown function (DUF3800)